MCAAMLLPAVAGCSGGAFSAPLTADRVIRWRLSSHDKPAPRALRVELRMGHVEESGECVLLVASLRRTQPRRG